MNTTLISILGGLGGMLGWGTSDFFANFASDKVGHTKAFFWSQIAGLLFIILLFVVVRPPVSMTSTLFSLTMFSGVLYAVGYLFFYKGFEIGNVSVVSAVVNIQIPIIMIISFIFHGQTLTTIQIPSVFILLIGILLVSVNFADFGKKGVSVTKGVKETLVAAVVFGLYWPVSETIVEQTDWLFVAGATKLAALVFVFFLTFFQKKTLQIHNPTKKLMGILAVVGFLEALAILSVTVGLSHGDAILVAPIASALTIVTVSLAVVFLKEKLTRQQQIGIVLAIGGIIGAAL